MQVPELLNALLARTYHSRDQPYDGTLGSFRVGHLSPAGANDDTFVIRTARLVNAIEIVDAFPPKDTLLVILLALENIVRHVEDLRLLL